jgi:hypothetical protein
LGGADVGTLKSELKPALKATSAWEALRAYDHKVTANIKC